MAAVYEMKALIERSPWNDVIAVGLVDDGKTTGDRRELRSPTGTEHRTPNRGREQRSSPTSSVTSSPNADIMNTSHKQVTKTTIVHTYRQVEPTFNNSTDELRPTVTSSSPSSIGFSIDRILSNNIGICHVVDGNASPPRMRKLGQTTVPADQTSFRLLPSGGVHRSTISPLVNHETGPGKRSDWKDELPAISYATVPSGTSLSVRRCSDGENDQREQLTNDFIDSNEDDFAEDDDDFSDNQSMPTDDGEYDLKKRDVDGVVTAVNDTRHHSTQLMDFSDCPSGLQKLSWLQCTRYKPPKLPRSKKLKDGSKKRKLGRNPRVPFTQHQVTVLEHKFHRTHYLSSVDVAELSAALNLTENRVKIWFQNRRARERRNKEPDHVTSSLGNHGGVVSRQSSPTDVDRSRITSSTSPSTPTHSLQHQIPAASNAFLCRDKTNAAAAAAVAAAACYPETIMRHFNSSMRVDNGVCDVFTPSSSSAASSLMSWPYHLLPSTARHLPVGLRIPGCSVSGSGGGFAAAADLLAHLSSTSSTSVSSTKTTMNNVIIGLSGMAAAAVGVAGRSRVPTFTALHGFLR